MFQFLLTQIFMISLGLMLYLVIRALPRIEEHNTSPAKRGVFEKWLTSEIPERLDEASRTVLEKAFRKLKVLLLRFDNVLTERLRKIKPEGNGNGKAKFDFSEFSSSNGKENEEKR